MKSYISSIGTANPPHRTPQSHIADFMANALSVNGHEKVRMQALYRASGIANRYSVLEDYGNTMEHFSFYPANESLEPFPTTAKRMHIYKQEALRLAIKAISCCFEALPQPIALHGYSHLITVSCTGMYAPGIDIEIVQALGLRSDIKRTSINFMGCYAAFNAIKVGDAICRAEPEAKVLIVCVELCSIHFQKENNRDDVLASALFGDGAAAFIMQGQPPSSLSLCLEQFHCGLDFDGKHEMGWHIGDHGFEMKLSSDVPEMLGGKIRSLTHDLLEKVGRKLDQIDYYAVHPGGKKILEAVEKALGLRKEDNQYAYEVLRQYGNMSSPTILFILKALSQDLSEDDHGKYILSLAFGPGLTMESMILKVNYEAITSRS